MISSIVIPSSLIFFRNSGTSSSMNSFLRRAWIYSGASSLTKKPMPRLLVIISWF